MHLRRRGNNVQIVKTQPEAVTGKVGDAIQRFGTGRMQVLGAEPPSRIERIIAEFQLGDPTGTRDAFRPWSRRTRSHRDLPAGGEV